MGEFYLNDCPLESIWQYKNLIGFISQDCVLDGRMTVRETFEFYYSLRRDSDETWSSKQKLKKNRIDEVISLLWLESVQNTIVGDENFRGISGGERKRVSIGLEMIKNPYLLFADEPTTGLDSSNACNVVSILKELNQWRMTVVCTIH